MNPGLLLISEPSHYPSATADVSVFYRAAANSDIPVWHVPPQNLPLDASQGVEAIAVPRDLNHQVFLGLNHQPTTTLPLQTFGSAFCRTLKPFPPEHLQTLERLEASLQFLNRPSSKRRQMEAQFLPEIAGPFLPPMINSRDTASIERFIDLHGSVVAKRGNSTQAQGVFRIQKTPSGWSMDHCSRPCRNSPSLEALLTEIKQGDDQPLQIVRFLSGTSAGDKRVLVVDGTILGAFRRRSNNGHWVNNLAVGGLCSTDSVGDCERMAIDATWPIYQAMGLRVLGYDFLRNDDGGWCISEINAGNIGGFSRLDQLNGAGAMQHLLKWISEQSQRASNVIIRAARETDHAAIAWIYQQAVDAGCITMDRGRFGAQDITLKHAGASPRDILLVAEKRDEVVGWAELRRYSPRAGYDATAETSIYVHRSEQGRGIGNTLLKSLIQQASDQGDRHLVAKVVASNPDSVRFHQRLGFSIVGTQHRIGHLNGNWFDVVILERQLP
ncbi:MAG: GNAT family N-acetyltransferase [Synechococcus sp.]